MKDLNKACIFIYKFITKAKNLDESITLDSEIASYVKQNFIENDGVAKGTGRKLSHIPKIQH